MSEPTVPATNKGQRRRQEIVEGAAAILREQGPSGVSHRTVAQRVGCSLSATTYYFSGLDDLLSEAGRVNIARWASRAERVAEAIETDRRPTTREGKIDAILKATLPTDEEMLGHYLQLVAAGESPPVSRAYRTGRDRLNAAVTRVLERLGSPMVCRTDYRRGRRRLRERVERGPRRARDRPPAARGTSRPQLTHLLVGQFLERCLLRSEHGTERSNRDDRQVPGRRRG